MLLWLCSITRAVKCVRRKRMAFACGFVGIQNWFATITITLYNFEFFLVKLGLTDCCGSNLLCSFRHQKTFVFFINQSDLVSTEMSGTLVPSHP